jgi:cytochrome c-type biogenesis protein CcmH/NrfF
MTWKQLSTRIAVLVCLMANFGTAQAAKPTVEEVARQVVCQCPDCGKQTVDQCAPGCAEGKQHKELIGQQIKQGKSAEQIVDFIALKYGEQMRAAPKAQGFGAAAYALPVAGVLAGLLPLGLILRSRRKKENSDAPRVVSTHDAEPARAENARQTEDPRVAAALKEIDF